MKIEERVLAKEDETDKKLTELARRDQGIADREIHLKELQDDRVHARMAMIRDLFGLDVDSRAPVEQPAEQPVGQPVGELAELRRLRQRRR